MDFRPAHTPTSAAAYEQVLEGFRRRLQLLLLDTRWSRSALLPTDCPMCEGKERYVPYNDSGGSSAVGADGVTATFERARARFTQRPTRDSRRVTVPERFFAACARAARRPRRRTRSSGGARRACLSKSKYRSVSQSDRSTRVYQPIRSRRSEESATSPASGPIRMRIQVTGFDEDWHALGEVVLEPVLVLVEEAAHLVRHLARVVLEQEDVANLQLGGQCRVEKAAAHATRTAGH